MIKVTLHHAAPNRVSQYNCLGHLDIGNVVTDALATYKLALRMSGLSQQLTGQVLKYPRWSATPWDLIARAVCIAFGGKEATDVLPFQVQASSSRAAFMAQLTAQAEHWPDGAGAGKSVVGHAHIVARRRPGYYVATFDSDILGSTVVAPFWHAPSVCNPWTLFVAAYCFGAQGDFTMPPRPTLYVPIAVQHENESLVALDTLIEPARTGMYRWLLQRRLEPVACNWLQGPCVTEAQFVSFLRRSV